MFVRIDGQSPQVAASAWIAPTATLIGDVIVEEDASIWYGVVVRADVARITIGPRSNIQDNTVCHADPGSPLTVGADVTVGHAAILHGCTIEDGALIGMGSTVLNQAVVGAGSLVGANSLVTEGAVIPPGSLAAGAPAVVRRPLREAETARILGSAAHYADNARRHRQAEVLD